MLFPFCYTSLIYLVLEKNVDFIFRWRINGSVRMEWNM